MPFFILVIGGKINPCVRRCDMKRDKDKTKEQLLDELAGLHQQLAESEALERDNKSHEEIYRNLVNMSPDVMYIGSPEDGAFLFLNLAFEKITGWSRAEWVGRPFMPIVHPDDLPLVMERFQQGLEGEIPLPFEARFLCKSGDYVAGEVIGVPHIVNGKVVEGYGFVRNITERKRAEEALLESEEKYRIVADNTYDWEWWLSPAGEFIYTSPSCSRITGYDASEFMGNVELFRNIIHPADLPIWDNNRRETSQGKVAPAIEFRIRHKDGSERWIEHICQPVFDDAGMFQGSRGSNRDITDRKQAEEKIQRSEERYRSFVQNFNGIAYRGDVNFHPEFFHGAIEKITGYTEQDFMEGKIKWDRIIHKDDLPGYLEKIQERTRLKPLVAESEFRIKHRNGSIRWIHEVFQTIFNDSGQLIGSQGIQHDITERKKAEEALRESEMKYRSLVDQSLLGILIVQGGRIRYANKIMTEKGGYSADELMSLPPMKVAQLIHPKDRKIVWNRMLSRLSGKKEPARNECRLLAKDGTVYWTDVHTNVVEYLGKPAVQMCIVDITDRKQAEEKLKESEEKYRNLVENSKDTITIVDLQGNIIFANKVAEQLTGYSLEEGIGMNLRDFIAPEYLSQSLMRLQEAIEGEMVPYFETAVRRKDDTIVPIETSGHVIWKEGEPVGVQIIARDITERKKAEETLRESEEKLRLMYESVTEGIIITDLNGIIVDANEAAVRMNGCDSKKQLIGRSSFEFIAGRDHARAAENLKKTLEQGRSGIIEYTLLREDGSEFPGELSASLIRDKSGNPASFVAITRDITERKLIEKEQQIMERLESIGTLAGGIAHDFNNLLTGIMGNIGLAKRHVEPGGKAFERLEEAEKATVRARDLTQQLLTFARGGTPVKKPSDISEIIRETAAFALRGSNVRLEISLPDDLWATEVDQGQMNQVIQNIVINADEAMPSGGTLHISAQNMVIKRPGMLPLPKGKYVRVDIEDEGIGMSKKQLERIFEPYYTTKQKGSGLGLATAYSIVKNHGGYITVESKQNVGTTFHVYLPASEKSSPTREEVKREMGTTGKGKVLVMDDEEIIREMLGKMLPLAGYEVDLTSDGAEVIERYAQAMKVGKPFNAVIMDLTIPGGMGGKEAIKKLLEIDPDAKVIVSSGYSTDPIMSEYKEYGFSAVVTKPYSVTEIEKTLNDILSR
jgi:PAS domain S-box-containing protein